MLSGSGKAVCVCVCVWRACDDCLDRVPLWRKNVLKARSKTQVGSVCVCVSVKHDWSGLSVCLSGFSLTLCVWKEGGTGVCVSGARHRQTSSHMLSFFLLICLGCPPFFISCFLLSPVCLSVHLSDLSSCVPCSVFFPAYLALQCQSEWKI